MAKDGTNRGGRRVRAGDKPDALADKIANGREATVMEVECDNQVFALLGELEKVIEKNGGDKSLPDKILGVYLNEKQLTKAKYISELEKRGLIL